jgi:hypothetical protein
MLMLLALAQAATSGPVLRPRAPARAAVRIERAGVATKAEWDRLPAQHRRQLIRRDEFGRSIAIRVIEHE